MKKALLIIAALSATFSQLQAQELMRVETTDGYVRTYWLEDMNRVYFQTREEWKELSLDCDIELKDEVQLTDCAAFEFSYDEGIQYVYAGYFTAAEVKQYSDGEIGTITTGGGTPDDNENQNDNENDSSSDGGSGSSEGGADNSGSDNSGSGSICGYNFG